MPFTYLHFLMGLSCAAVTLGARVRPRNCKDAVPEELVSQMQRYALTHDNEVGGAFSVRGESFDTAKTLAGAETGYLFAAPPWPAPAMFHVHPVHSLFLPSAADFDALLRNAVNHELNKDYNFCPSGEVCAYEDTDVCDSFLGTKREVVFAPNGVYVYGPNEALIQKVAASDDPEALMENLLAKLGPFDCDDCWPNCGRRTCHLHPWSKGKGNYKSGVVGTIKPFADCGKDGKNFKDCVVPISATTMESHAKYIKFLAGVGGMGVGFDLDFYPYGSTVCLSVQGSTNKKLDPFAPMCKPDNATSLVAVSASALGGAAPPQRRSVLPPKQRRGEIFIRT